MVTGTEIKTLVQRLKAVERGEKANVTFRLSKKAVAEFKKACARQKLKPGTVVEELMKLFADEV